MLLINLLFDPVILLLEIYQNACIYTQRQMCGRMSITALFVERNGLNHVSSALCNITHFLMEKRL